MLNERPLTEIRDLVAFAQQYERVGGFPLSADSLQHSRVMGFYQGDELVGGYVVNESAPFRALQNMSESDARRIQDLTGERGICEVTCVWMQPAIRRTLAGNTLWLFVVRAIIANRSHTVVVSTVSESLRRFYEDMGFTVVYSGQIDMPDGTSLPKYVMTLDSVTPIVVSSLRIGVRRYSEALAKAVAGRMDLIRVRPHTEGVTS